MDAPLRIARVHIQLKTRALSSPYDYLVPERLDGAVRPGATVLVPFGRQKALGIVAGLATASELPRERLLEVEEAPDFPAIPETLLELALWVADYYYCSRAAALGLVLPPGGLPPLVSTVAEGGRVYTLKAPRIKPRLQRFMRATGATGGRKLSTARQRVLELLSQAEELPPPELAAGASVSRDTLRQMAADGQLESFEREVRRDSLRYYGGGEEANAPAPPGLNEPQRQALKAAISRLDAAGSAERWTPLLLFGVPGSGKTEVYMRAIEEAINRGGTAIVLVPEISLTHQTVKRFRRRFGEEVGVLHSGLTPGERYDEYMRIRRGVVRVVIGPRSALFAPLDNLKLIVIDEENDSSYKQESEPRYDARRTALQRARLEGAAVIFGSATPSLESYRRISDHCLLPERATGAALPVVETVDMREEEDILFSRRLLAELDVNLRAGEKSILLLNRRGYASYMQCGHCGHVWQCEHCEVSLTIHARRRQLLCHHCGYSAALPDICPGCGAAELKRWGVGSERLESEVRARFPEAPVYRLDAETAAAYGGSPRILKEFAEAPGAILVGTQMVGKGHHFPDVTLSAMLNADLSLQFPEFRAEEHTFAQVLQLAGRSGRAGKPGRVIVQTWNPDIECIRLAAAHATDEFYALELKRRERLGYPPFVELVNIVCLAGDEEKAGKAIAWLKDKLAPALDGEELLGPAPLFKLKGWHRGHLLIKTASVEKTLAACRPVIEALREPYRRRGVRIIVDVDPQWLS